MGANYKSYRAAKTAAPSLFFMADLALVAQIGRRERGRLPLAEALRPINHNQSGVRADSKTGAGGGG